MTASAQFTITENFKGNSAGSNIVVGGSPNTAYLTSGNVDPVNDGWLRLTDAITNQRGYAYVNVPFPSTLGVYMDFEYKSWRDKNDPSYNGADGFSVFMFDASANFALGGWGGSLGYAPNNASSPAVTNGLAGGYIGLGIDEYGNFAAASEGKNGGTAGLAPNSFVLRGPTTSNANTTNKYLSSVQLQTNSNSNISSVDYNTVTSTRPTDGQFYRRVKISITPAGTSSNPLYTINVTWRTSPNGADSTLLSYTTTTAPPQNLKVGFAASTGGGFNYHEIRNLVITTPGGVRVDKTVDKINANVGDQVTYTVNAYNSTTAAISNLKFADTLKDNSGNILAVGPSGYLTLNSITFNDNGGANTATGFTSGVAKTTGLTNPFNTTLNMQANSNATFTVKGTINGIPPNGVLKNTAAVDPSLTGISELDTTNNIYTVTSNVLSGNVDFVVSKNVDNTCADPVNGNTYTLSVSNSGATNSMAGQTVTVTDVIPAGFTVTSATGTGWTVSNSGNTYTFKRTDALNSTFAFPAITIKVKPPSSGTSWTNTATVAYSGTEANTTNNSSSVTIYGKPAAPTAVTPITYCQGSNAGPLTATGNNLLWYTVAAGGTGITTAPTPNTGTAGTTTYYVSQKNGTCESSLTPLVVNINASPAAPTGNATQTFCQISNPTIASLVATGTNIQWYSAATGGTALTSTTALTDGTTYYASQTANGCESVNRLAVKVTITATAAPTGNATQTFCQISNPTIANLVATGTDIQWYAVATGGTAIASTTALTDGTTYYASQTANGCESVNRLAVKVTIMATAAPTGNATQTFCQISNPTVANLVAMGTNIQWYAAATGGAALSSATALTDGSTYYASQTANGCESVNRLAVKVTITITAAPTGNAAQTFCQISNPTIASLVATGTNIQWYATATGGTALANTAVLTDGTIYYASQTANGCESVNRLAVKVTITFTAAPTGNATQTFCQISNPTVASLVATGTNVQWYTAATGGTALSSAVALTDGTTYYASQTANGCESVNRLAVKVAITSTLAPTGNTTQIFCQISNPTIASLVATGTNIQWYTAATGGTALASTTALTDGTTYYASQTSNGCESANRLAVKVTITSTAAPTGNATQTFCQISNPTVANLVATGTNIQWYAAASGGTALASTTALTDGAIYYASQTSNGCESVNRLAVNVTITSTLAPTSNATQTFCQISNPTIANLVATGTNIQWYTSTTGGTALSTTMTLTDGTTYYASQTANGCESVNRLAIKVTITTTVAPTGNATQTFCQISNPTIANLVATGTNIQWYAVATGGTALVSTTALVDGTTYYASQTANGCESVNRLAVKVTISSTLVPTGNATQTFCQISNPTVASLVATGTNIQWYSAAIGGTALSSTTTLVDGTTYYASQKSNGCESVNRLAVNVTITATAAPTGNATQTFCQISNPTITSLVATGTNILWYAAATGGTALASTTALTDGTTYYASQTSNGCESVNRLAVKVTISSTLAPTGNATQTFCQISNPTISSLVATGTNVQWYASATGATALSSAAAALTDGTTYYASQTTNGCESVNRLAVKVTITITAAPTGNATQTFCQISNPTIADLVATGANIQWYAATTGGTPLASTTTLVDGTTYYASQTANGCESVNRLAVKVTITSTLAPTGNATQTFCQISNPTIPSLVATGTNIQWYTSTTGGTALSTTMTLTDGTTYYASQTANGCESVNRLAVKVTITATAVPTSNVTQAFCQISNPTVASLVATGTNIQWYVSATGGAALSSATALTDGTIYYASQTSNGCESVNRLAVKVTITSTLAPTGNTTQTFCQISNPTIANLVATGTSVQWYATATGGTALASTTALTDDITYYANQTSNGCESVNRLAIKVAITTIAAPIGNATQTFCQILNPTVASLVATGTNIQWYAAASTGGIAIASTTALTDGTTYYASQTANGCESVSRLAVKVTLTSTLAPTGNATQTFCQISNPTIASLVATGANIQWYASATGGTVLASTTALVDGTTYYASQTANGCESVNRLAVKVTITATAAPTGNATQTFCQISNPTVAGLVATGTNIQWYTTATGGTAIVSTTALVDGTTYYASQTANGCESVNRFAVKVTVTSTVAPTGNATQTFCQISNATIASLVVTGANIQWYIAATGGTTLASTTALIDGTTYYASQTANGCESVNRFAVTVKISSQTIANAGADIVQYNSGSFTLAANSPSTGTGVWSIVAGNPVVDDVTKATTIATIPENTTATLRWTIDNGVCPASTDDVVIKYVRQSDLAIQKTAPASIIEGGTITWRIQVQNNGPSDADKAIVTDVLPAGIANPVVTVVSSTTGANATATITGNVMTAVLDKLPANGQCVLQITGVLQSVTGKITNTATITTPANVTDPTTGNNTSTVTTTITPKSKLKIEKSVLTAGPYYMGQTVRYALKVTNTGEIDVNPVTVTDLLPSTAKVGAPVIQQAPAGTWAGYNSAANTINWNVGLLAAGKSLTLTYDLNIRDTGMIKNTVFTAGPPDRSIPDTSTVTVNAAYYVDLAIIKQLVQQAIYEVGKYVTFNIAVTNNGPNTATNIQAEDALPQNLDAVRNIKASTGSAVYDAATNTVLWNIRSLSVKDTLRLSFDARIKGGDMVTNTASVTSDENDLDRSNNNTSITPAKISGKDDIWIPNIITPNGDGKNDKFIILGIERYPGSTVEIYNRWQNMVYTSPNYNNDWDGKELNSGTYYYVLKINKSGGKEVRTGWIMLVK